MTKICLSCGEEYIPCRSHQRVQKYCSVACYHKTRHKLGSLTLEKSRGYIRMNVGPNQRTYEHIVKAERALGRPLKPGECVHHINCNESDNRNSNLLICTRSFHSWIHWEMSRRYAKEHLCS